MRSSLRSAPVQGEDIEREKREEVEFKIRSSSGWGYGGGEKIGEVELKTCSS